MGEKVALIIPDNGSKHHWYPLGTGQIATTIRSRGGRVWGVQQDAYHMPVDQVVEHISSLVIDVVGIGWISGRHTHDNALALCRAVKDKGLRLVIGGHAPSSDPKWYLGATGADAVIVGDADGVEEPWSEMSGVVEGKRSEEWWPWHETREELLYYPMVHAPGALPADRVAPVITGFGCPYECSFCFRLTRGRQQRPVEEIAHEILWLKENLWITFIQFQDELLMTGPRRTAAVCEAIRDLGIGWSCQGRVNVAAENPEILDLMAEVGCRFINYGVESADQGVLDLMKKRQIVEQSRVALEATRKAGISPGVNMLWGCPGDSEASLWAGVDMIKEYSDLTQRRTIRPVTPYPGSPLFHQAVAEGKLEGTGDFWEKFTNSDLITVDFMDIPRADAHRMLYEANLELLRHHHAALDRHLDATARRLYIDGDADFRGWRQI